MEHFKYLGSILDSQLSFADNSEYIFKRCSQRLFLLRQCHESGCHSPHYSCTSPMDYNSHHSLHYDTHIPIHHCTNHTAVTNHSLTLIVSPHLHLIHTHTHTHISSTLPYKHCEVLFLPRLTFLSVTIPSECYFCV